MNPNLLFSYNRTKILWNKFILGFCIANQNYLIFKTVVQIEYLYTRTNFNSAGSGKNQYTDYNMLL